MRQLNLRIACFLLLLAPACTPVLNAQALKSGAAVRQPVFGGSGPNFGWGSLGLITTEAMKFYGWDVQICNLCAAAKRAARLVAAAAVLSVKVRGIIPGSWK